MMMNNPVAYLLTAAKKGTDPMQALQQIAGRDPQMQMALNMLRGKSPQQLRQMAENMARERGTTVDAVINQLGL